ncbi:c-type cytochrome [Albidovulum sp.]
MFDFGNRMRMARAGGAALAALVLGLAGPVLADEHRELQEHGPHQQEFVHGAPQVPSLEWTIAAGGRIYDNWWEALDREEPEGTNPAWPVAVNDKQSGAGTWRCKECHGWDYLGAEGIYRKGSHFTGIKGVMGAAGRPPAEIAGLLRDANHPYTTEMITDEEMLRVATFVSAGLIDMREFIDYDTRTVKVGVGDLDRGRAIFQTTCAACHGFDGRALDWGEDGEHNFIGTEAAALPDEVMNKISNAHPGAAMINLRAFSLEDRISVMAYIAGLPTGIDD